MRCQAPVSGDWPTSTRTGAVLRQPTIRNRWKLGFVLLVLGVSGCSRRDVVRITGPEASQYTLRAIDNQALPHQIDQSPDGTVTTVVDDMMLTVVSDGTWATIGHETVTTNGTPAQVLVRQGGVYATTALGTTFRDPNGAVVWKGESLSPGYLLTDAQGRAYRFGP